MNHFFLQLVADKKIKRQIKLLQTIYDAHYPISLEEISNDLDTTTRTLSRDLKDLDEILPEKDTFQLVKTSGYVISREHDVDNLILHVSEQSPLFKIIYSIYDEIFLTIDEWADELFLSPSTLYRYLNHLKKILKEYELELTLTPVSIVGSEQNIRFFYFYYLYNTDDVHPEYKPNPKQFAIFEEAYNHFMEHTTIQAHIHHRSLLYWITVFNKRVAQGHYIKIDQQLIDIQKQAPSYVYIHKLAKILLPDVPLSDIPEDEIAYMDLLLLDNYIYHEGLRNPDDYPLDSHISNLIHTFLDDAFKKMSLQYENEAINEIFGFYLRNLYLISKVTPVFQKNYYEINKYIKSRHPKSYTSWLNILSESPLVKEFNLIFLEDIAVNLTMFSYYAVYKHDLPELNIYFAFDGKVAYLNYVEILIDNFVNNNLQVTMIANKRITKEMVKELGIDIVIHNYKDDDEDLGCLTYRTARVPNNHDWDMISELVYGAN
ncbi:helix-turn-helix domain-containing protein [Listeria rustica]|uniref:HTH domain-containing protein n=1 Tax=Listeria rustica TaxID=2713503 RepID=A0A7W1T6P8_9LIST|nr:helix-turn-helix domain-containing protein [Listeria rustica]MBA3926316.1 HTH domain-containing protein [Listeria rustica]